MPTTPLTEESFVQLMEQVLNQYSGGGGASGGGTPSAPGATQKQLVDLVPPQYKKALNSFKAGIEVANNRIDKFFAGMSELDKAAKAFSDPLRVVLLDVQNTYGGFRKASQEMQIGISQDIRESYDTFAETFVMTANELKDASKEKYVLEVDGTEINVLTDIFQNASEYQAQFIEFIDQYNTTYGPALGAGLKDSGMDVALFQKNFNLTSKELGDFVTVEVARTGEATTTMMDDLKKFSYGLSAQTGISAKLIAKDTVKIVSNVEKFGNVTVEEAARMSTALKQLGVDYSQLEGMIGQFQNFDTAAQKVGELSAVFGIHLDAVEMMTLANTDQEAAMFKLRDAFEDSGQSLEDMNIAQKNLLTQQAGFSDVKQMEMFFSGQVDSMEELQEMTEEAATEDSAAKAVEDFNKDLATLALQGQTAAQRVDKAKNDLVYSMQSLAPEIMDFRSSIQTGISAMGGEINQVVEKGVSGVDKLKNGIIGAFEGEDFGQIKKNLEEGFVAAFEAVPRAFGDTIKHMNDIFNASNLKGESPSPLGLNLVTGITDAFKTIPEEFEKELSEIENLALLKINTLNEQVKSLGLENIIESVDQTTNVASTNISDLLTSYQEKLEKVQSLVDAPDKVDSMLASSTETQTKINKLIDEMQASSEKKINFTYTGKGELDEILFKHFQNYVSVTGGSVDINYPK
jgi:hypothetical protein